IMPACPPPPCPALQTGPNQVPLGKQSLRLAPLGMRDLPATSRPALHDQVRAAPLSLLPQNHPVPFPHPRPRQHARFSTLAVVDHPAGRVRFFPAQHSRCDGGFEIFNPCFLVENSL